MAYGANEATPYCLMFARLEPLLHVPVLLHFRASLVHATEAPVYMEFLVEGVRHLKRERKEDVRLELIGERNGCQIRNQR